MFKEMPFLGGVQFLFFLLLMAAFFYPYLLMFPSQEGAMAVLAPFLDTIIPYYWFLSKCR